MLVCNFKTRHAIFHMWTVSIKTLLCTLSSEVQSFNIDIPVLTQIPFHCAHLKMSFFKEFLYNISKYFAVINFAANQHKSFNMTHVSLIHVHLVQDEFLYYVSTIDRKFFLMKNTVNLFILVARYFPLDYRQHILAQFCG